MSVHLSIVLLFTGLTGLHSITTVSEVSVKAGGSISIPCLYESEHTHHVKYLCDGYHWVTCSYTVKTDQAGSSQKFSISDDKDQRIFTVTINDLTDDDSHYWCVVEIKDGSDVGKYFRLSVTRGSPQLYVDHQEMTGFNGGDVTINCYHSISGEGGWCRLGGSCVKESSGSIDGTKVIINVNVPGVVTVTMRGLRTESSGWYFCVKGDLQMPVHLTVNERPTTTAAPLTTVPVDPTTDPAAEAPAQSDYYGASIYPLSLMIALTVLTIILIVTSLIWFMLKRYSQTKAQSSALTVRKRRRKLNASHAEGDVDVLYRSVVIKRQQDVQRVERNEQDVTYSTLA
ncbi:uncharacterized protein LOC113156831 isoform X2 [Anabas testudineus]|uniref:uncharacterized protein LOC113156831 isoform X2 n=1 Tax=Anabas testudineus TaxID=64144 RepID=UPI000E45DEB4|nr:uncharacterized protein LOC113156831 isoform X2 [Anabas testudineus]